MKIAIIGGGASGIATAYLLRNRHRATIFEKNGYLGGNVRTLNGNVTAPGIPSDLRVENGVLAFNRKTYPIFYRLMDELGISMKRVFGSTGLYFLRERKNYLLAPADKAIRNPLHYAHQTFRSLAPGIEIINHYRSVFKLPQDQLDVTSLSDTLNGETISSLWLRGLKMSAFSTPFNETGTLPVSISKPKTGAVWHIIPDGIYSYMQKMLELSKPAVVLNAKIKAIRRESGGVQIHMADGQIFTFDKVIFAVVPGQVLRLLADPTEDERRRFSEWSDLSFETVAHTDTAMYQGFRTARFTNADIFLETEKGAAGYNAYLSDLYGIAPRLHYSYAHNLDEFIPQTSVIDRWTHNVARFSVAAVRTQQEIRAFNGENHTYFAGAYLYQGWHEGAMESATAVSNRL